MVQQPSHLKVFPIDDDIIRKRYAQVQLEKSSLM